MNENQAHHNESSTLIADTAIAPQKAAEQASLSAVDDQNSNVFVKQARLEDEAWMNRLIEESSSSFIPPLEAYAKNPRWLPIFDQAQVNDSLIFAEFEEKPGQPSTLRPILEAAQAHRGYRRIPEFKASDVIQKLKALRNEMPNFAPATEALMAEFGFSISASPREFRIEPMLLVGAPGLGKTRFVNRLASILNIPCEKIAIGMSQSNGDLAGTGRFWSNTRPGRLSRLMAKSEVACPIVLLDEIDKIGGDNRYPVMPVLLDLLEPDSAKQFRDESLEIPFDMSRAIVIATANDLSLIDGALCSRFRVVQITPPSAEQKKTIIRNLLKELIGSRDLKIELGTIDRLAEIEVDLREIRRELRGAIGHVLLRGSSVLRQQDIQLKSLPPRRSIGFL